MAHGVCGNLRVLGGGGLDHEATSFEGERKEECH